MVVVPAGRARLGGDRDAQARQGAPPDIAVHELPQYEVAIARPFALAQTFVTRRDFARFIAATSREVPSGCNVLLPGAKTWGTDPSRSWRDPGFPQTDDDPVVCVSWPDAVAYTDWLSTQAHYPYRLPTEAEYEYAARAGKSENRYWGEGVEAACQHANVSGLERADAHKLSPDPAHFFPCRDRFVETSPAKSFPPNPWGFYDMLGDVWEWTQDCYNPTNPAAPSDGSARMTGDCAGHVDKGSSWVNSPHYLSTAARHKDLTDNRDTVLGFRVARDLAP